MQKPTTRWNYFLNLLLTVALLLPVFFAVTANAATQMKHTPPDYFVSGQRIQLEAKVTDDQGIKLVRCYFKASGEADLVFVPMTDTGKSQYAGILPAPSAATTQIEYLFLAVNQANQVVRSQNFTMTKDENKETPAWQDIPKEGEIRVSIEIDQAPTQLMGFSDNVTIDVVESTARFGVVALLYHTIRDSDSKEAGALSSSGGASEAAVTSAASATGATSAGVITAGTAGWSTAAIIGVSLGVAGAVAGGTVAVVNAVEDETDDEAPKELTPTTIVGAWNVTGTSIYDWSTEGDLTFNEDGSVIGVFHNTEPDGTNSDSSGSGTWNLTGSSLTLYFDGGAVYTGTADGNSQAFQMVDNNIGWTLNFVR